MSSAAPSAIELSGESRYPSRTSPRLGRVSTRRSTWVLAAILACVLFASGLAADEEASSPGRYVLGGTERDGLILLDTATGRTWKYDRRVQPPYDEPVWIPLNYVESEASAPSPAAAVAPPGEESGDSGGFQLRPSPYKHKKPGGAGARD